LEQEVNIPFASVARRFVVIFSDSLYLHKVTNLSRMEIPVKSHTHSGLIRTVKREKKLAKNILH